MASTYVNHLRLEEITDGEQAGTWGATTNTNLELIGQAFAWGTRAIANASTDNITIADGAADADRSLALKLTGGGQACTVTLLPNTSSKVWIMNNATSYTLTFTCGSGADVAVLAGETKVIATDGLGSGGVVYDLLTNLANAGTLTTAGDITTSSTVKPLGDTAADDKAALGYTSVLGAILTGQGSTNDVTLVNDADATVLSIPTGSTDITVAGTIQPLGDTAASDIAALGYTSVLGLILTGQGSTNDVTLVNDADATVLSVPTGSLDITVAGTVQPLGDTAASDIAAIGYTSVEGLILTGQGSTSDVVIKNDADATVASIATGTTIFTLNDDVSVAGRAFSPTLTANLGSAIDLSLGNNFLITTTGDVVLTFTNQIAGQSGTLKFVNDSNRAVTAHTNVAISTADLTTISATGTYMVSYFVAASDAANTILVSASAILT